MGAAMSESESCPACGLQTDGARFCRGCGSEVKAPSPIETPRTPASAGPQATASSGLYDVARYQRYILLIIVASIMGLAATTFVTGALGPEYAVPILTVMVVVIALLRMAFVYKLAVAVGISVGWAVFAAICGIHGLAGLIALLVVNSRATKALQQAGLRVGLFGVRSEDLRSLAGA